MTDFCVNKDEGAETPVSLLLRLQQDSQLAWERLVRLYSPLVYRWCRHEGLRAEDAADVGQEVFQAVAQSIRKFRRDRDGDTFRGWLRTITRNKARDFFRDHREAVRAIGGEKALANLKRLPFEEHKRSEAPDSAERMFLYRRAMDIIRLDFEEVTWNAFWRTVVEGHMPADVASDLGISLNAVYLARSRILRRFRDEFDELVGSEPA